MQGAEGSGSRRWGMNDVPVRPNRTGVVAYMQHCPDPCNAPSLAGSPLTQRRQTLHNRSRCSALTYECGQHDGHGINGHSEHLFVVCQHTHYLLVGKPAGGSSNTWQDSKPLNAGLHNIHAVAVKHACTGTFKVQLRQPGLGKKIASVERSGTVLVHNLLACQDHTCSRSQHGRPQHITIF